MSRRAPHIGVAFIIQRQLLGLGPRATQDNCIEINQIANLLYPENDNLFLSINLHI